MNNAPLILAFGDSLVAGHGLPSVDGFAAQLERRLRHRHPAARVVNAGVSGDTTTGALRRLPRLLTGLRHRPDLAIVQIGPNDVLFGVPPARTRDQLDAILVEFARCGVPVLLTTVTPPSFLAARTAPYLAIPEEVSRRHRVPLCPFFPVGVLGAAGMVLADGIHPNARAIAAVVEGMAPAIEARLADTIRAAD